MAFAADAGSRRDLYEAWGIGAVTWLATAFLIVWLWRAAKRSFLWLVPIAWWYPSWLLAFSIAYGWVWNDPVAFGYFA